MHCIENTAVYWFQAIAQIWDGATDDNRHCIVEIRGFHFLFDRDLWPIIGLFFTYLFGGVVRLVGHVQLDFIVLLILPLNWLNGKFERSIDASIRLQADQNKRQ